MRCVFVMTWVTMRTIVSWMCRVCFFFQAEDGIRDAQESRGLGDVYKRQPFDSPSDRERVQRMRRKVIEVLRETRIAERPASPEAAAPAPPAEPAPEPEPPAPSRAPRRRRDSTPRGDH